MSSEAWDHLKPEANRIAPAGAQHRHRYDGPALPLRALMRPILAQLQESALQVDVKGFEGL